MSSAIESMLSIAPGRRDVTWERNFLRELPAAKVRVLNPEPQVGPDHWPYLFVSTEGDEASLEPITDVLNWLSTRGIGLAVNPHKTTPDIVLTYGMIWNFRERGEFITDQAGQPEKKKIELRNGQEVLAGPPSEAYLPKYARSILKQFLLDQGVVAPKVLMVSFDKVHFDLCFSLESLGSPPEHEHEGIAEALSWFLPMHYPVSLISEKTIPGFQPL